MEPEARKKADEEIKQMFKFHYVQMEHELFGPISLEDYKKFKFHYVQMELLRVF